MKKQGLILSGLLVAVSSLFAQWSSDPSINNAIALAPGEQAIPKVATSGNGVTYISWFSNESGNYNVRLQKLDVYGVPQWDTDGLLVSSHPSMTWLTDWDMTVDTEGCCILTFQDIRTGNNDVFAYRISADGEFLWGEDGLGLSTGPAFDAAPKVSVSAAGNAFFAWQAENVIIGQKISPDGTLLWGPNGLVLSGNNTYSWPQLLPVGDDDIIMKFFEDSGPVWAPTRHVYAQRFSGAGNMVWAQPAVISNAGGITAWTQIFPFVNDGNDGFYIAWNDDRDMNNLSSVYVQHIGPDGSVLLNDDGIEASLLAGRQRFYAKLALPPGSEDIYVFWGEKDADQNNHGIYGQRISAAGQRVWGDYAKKFIELSPLEVYPFEAQHAGNDLVLFYEENPSFSNAVIKAMCMNPEGSFVWPGDLVSICSLPSTKVHPVAGTLNDGQWIISWEDERNGGKDIYAQNLKLDGTLGPITLNPEIAIIPDTLFIDENMFIYHIEVINVSGLDYLVDTIYTHALFWALEDLPGFSYIIQPGDSLTLNIPVFYTGMSGMETGYVYDTLFVESSWETSMSIVAFNYDIALGITKANRDLQMMAYPNPFTREVNISFDLTDHVEVEVVVFDNNHKIAECLPETFLSAGRHTIAWDGKDFSDNFVGSGCYFVALRVGEMWAAVSKIIK